MNNDLISRLELKKALKSNCDTLCKDKNTNWCEHCCPINDFEDLIDNAPTVEPEPYFEKAEKDKRIYERGFEDGQNARPQGEWEKPFEMNGKTYHKCNHCHISSELILIDKFCPNCGARMIGGAE